MALIVYYAIFGYNANNLTFFCECVIVSKDNEIQNIKISKERKRVHFYCLILIN